MGKGTEGIRLEFQTMKYNPGFRQVVKIMLNSVWGNFQGEQGRSVLELNGKVGRNLLLPLPIC